MKFRKKVSKSLSKSLIAGILILTSISIKAQVFELKIKTAQDDWLYSATELSSGGYALVMARGVYDETVPEYPALYEQYIMKISYGGDLVDSLGIKNNQPPYVEFMGIIGFEGFTVCWGRMLNANFSPVGLYLLKTDNDLNILTDTVLSISGSLLLSSCCVKNSSGNLIISGRALNTLTNEEGGFVWEISSGNLSRIRENYYSDLPDAYFIMELPSIGGYHYYSRNFIYGLDYALNSTGLLWAKSGIEPLQEQGSRKRLNDSTYVVLGTKLIEFPDGEKPDLAFSAYNAAINPLNYTSFGKVDTTDSPTMMDFIDPDSIFLSGAEVKVNEAKAAALAKKLAKEAKAAATAHDAAEAVEEVAEEVTEEPVAEVAEEAAEPVAEVAEEIAEPVAEVTEVADAPVAEPADVPVAEPVAEAAAEEPTEEKPAEEEEKA